MKNRSTLRYFIYLLFFGALLLGGFKIESNLKVQAEENFLLTPVFYYSIFFPVIYGALLAIPFIPRLSKDRKNLKYNWRKFSIFGIPSLLVLLFPAYYFTLLSWGDFIGFANILFGNERLHFFSGIILGFTIIYSIEYKEE
ncbi:hypothetical protein [Pseudalkalibacillus berkeleyi]|uniref:Uncharacterized protein n=1 Tax=Pseudalkalibacillus berkeleyi TaxID=1069813 RepID=A0ABS9GZ05_9BACL|nr:hypothetical protein [Pseudalkalibacillus berkeleyi]MCF6136762.1 hypothetical protein [Pseudalkalibacillus berkeleyi]